MRINTELAKVIWQDDLEMLKRIADCQRVVCRERVQDDLTIELTPYATEKDSGHSVVNTSEMDYSRIGKVAEISIFAVEDQQYVSVLCGLKSK